MKRNYTVFLDIENTEEVKKQSGNLSALLCDLIASWLNKPKEDRDKPRFLEEADEQIILAKARVMELEREKERIKKKKSKEVWVMGGN